ncbi:MAG TPA: FN3 domain-containing metallophosphoesterase family protein [Bacteroidales bacterium]|nr:FN3 domain-containing metallophosphoesterase family protein [Bacteroidales bacterium]
MILSTENKTDARCMLFYVLLFTFSIATNCFAQDGFKITHGPYLQNLNDTSVTIIWTTNRKAISWVELAPDDSTHFYLTERPKTFSASHGIKNIATIHTVLLDGLKPGTKFRYRIFSKEVTSHQGHKVLYGNTVASNVYSQKPFSFRTSDIAQKNTSFIMLNDIHGKSDDMSSLLKIAGYEKADFIIFNGDMMSNFNSEEQMFTDFMDTAVKVFAKEKPFYYARGNHETRGELADGFYKYFPGEKGNLYYLLRRGPVGIVFLDCGEDKPDSDIEYSDITAYDAYRTQQAKWLKEAVKDKSFSEAPFKVAIIHMPPFGGWHGEQEIANKFIPILNNAGIQIMLCGHLHKYIHQKAQSPSIVFPIIANANNTALKAEASDDELKISIINLKGETVDKVVIPRLGK